MAILSFAHLKNKKTPEQEQKVTAPPSGPSPAVRIPSRPAGAVMSFAYLKAAKKEQPVIAITTPEPSSQSPQRSTFRIPSVMPTALIHATNYCHGCGRFIPAAEFERAAGNTYGRCLRSIDIDADGLECETWKVIPSHATVSRCFFHQK